MNSPMFQPSKECLSVAYDPLRRDCRLSRSDQRGSRIVYDSDNDYYENLIGESDCVSPVLISYLNPSLLPVLTVTSVQV